MKVVEKDRVKNQPDNLDVIPVASHPTKTNKLLNWLAIGALAVIAIAIGIIMKWSFQDTHVLDIRNNPFPARTVADPTGQTGGIVFLRVDYCKNQAIDGTVRVSYISKSREVFLPVAKEQGPKGCENTELPVVIPLNLLKDDYKIKFHVTYDVNPLKQNVTEDFESQVVTVGTNVAN